MPDCGGYHFQTNTYGETRGLTASLMLRIGRLKLSSLNPLTVFDGAVGTWWLFCIASSTFDVETFTVIAGMEYIYIYGMGFPIWRQPAIFGRASMQQPQVWLDVWCLQPQRWFRFVSIHSERVTDQTWATQKSIGLNHGLSSFSTSTLQNLGIPHFCRLFEHRAKPMSFPYEWGDEVKTSYEMLWADVQ